ncbi:hypothetical protein ACVWZW_001068 [Bradyrhizobium sp. F1.13.4]
MREPSIERRFAHHDPVGGRAVELAALAPDIPHHLGVVALARHRVIGGIDGAEHIEIEEAVVDRGHQRVGHRVRKPHQVAVGAGRIDDDEVEAALDRRDRLHELKELRILVLGDLHGLAELDAAMQRQFEVELGAARPGGSVVDVVSKALLTAVEVDGGDALAGFQKRDCNVQGGGRLAGAALLVAEHDNMRRAGLALASLHKHRDPQHP